MADETPTTDATQSPEGAPPQEPILDPVIDDGKTELPPEEKADAPADAAALALFNQTAAANSANAEEVLKAKAEEAAAIEARIQAGIAAGLARIAEAKAATPKPAPVLAWVSPEPSTDPKAQPVLVAQLPVPINGHTQIRIDADANGKAYIACLGTVRHQHPVSALGTIEECRRSALAWFVLKIADNRGRRPEYDAVFARIEALLGQ